MAKPEIGPSCQQRWGSGARPGDAAGWQASQARDETIGESGQSPGFWRLVWGRMASENHHKGSEAGQEALVEPLYFLELADQLELAIVTLALRAECPDGPKSDSMVFS